MQMVSKSDFDAVGRAGCDRRGAGDLVDESVPNANRGRGVGGDLLARRPKRAAHGRVAGAILASRWCPHWRNSLLIVTLERFWDGTERGGKPIGAGVLDAKKTIGTKISACATPDVILVGFGSKAAVGEARCITYQGV